MRLRGHAVRGRGARFIVRITRCFQEEFVEKPSEVLRLPCHSSYAYSRPLYFALSNLSAAP